MKKRTLFLITLLISGTALFAQDKFFTKSGRISFYSKAPLEDIEAENRSVTAVLDTKTGMVQFAVPMKAFEFEKALMQEHFNENYIESDKYPKAEFKGQVLNNNSIDYTKDGEYPAKVKGTLTIHGQSKDVESNGKVVIKEGKVLTDATFNVRLSDYNISIPNLVKDKISNTVQVNVDCTLEPLKS
jgi:polyisoprenoid-binding protein YceI